MTMLTLILVMIAVIVLLSIIIKIAEPYVFAQHIPVHFTRAGAVEGEPDLPKSLRLQAAQPISFKKSTGKKSIVFPQEIVPESKDLYAGLVFGSSMQPFGYQDKDLFFADKSISVEGLSAGNIIVLEIGDGPRKGEMKLRKFERMDENGDLHSQTCSDATHGTLRSSTHPRSDYVAKVVCHVHGGSELLHA